MTLIVEVDFGNAQRVLWVTFGGRPMVFDSTRDCYTIEVPEDG